MGPLESLVGLEAGTPGSLRGPAVSRARGPTAFGPHLGTLKEGCRFLGSEPTS